MPKKEEDNERQIRDTFETPQRQTIVVTTLSLSGYEFLTRRCLF